MVKNKKDNENLKGGDEQNDRKAISNGSQNMVHTVAKKNKKSAEGTRTSPRVGKNSKTHLEK